METRFDPPASFEQATDELHEIAARIAGSDDFGPSDYRTGLTVLLQAMDVDPRFTEQGQRIAWGALITALAARASAHRSMNQHPGFETDDIVAPLVITGIPRSGTTALHRLLAVDPRFQGLQTWLLDSPMPRPPRQSWGDYPQYRRTVAEIEARSAAAPGKAAAHQSAADGLEEDCIILRQSFVSNIWNCMGFAVPTYDAWWQSQDEAAAYRYFKRCVQLIGSTDRERRFLLKNPGHIEHLEQIFAIFPDARVIQTHRDPAKAMPSMASLLMKLHPLMEQGPPDQRARIVGQREVAKWASAVRKADAVRATRPDQVLDVVHGDFHRDPMAVLQRIYAFAGIELPDELRPAFEQRIAERPELAHGKHRYDIADYRLSEEAVREAFGDYVARFDLLENAR